MVALRHARVIPTLVCHRSPCSPRRCVHLLSPRPSADAQRRALPSNPAFPLHALTQSPHHLIISLPSRIQSDILLHTASPASTLHYTTLHILFLVPYALVNRLLSASHLYRSHLLHRRPLHVSLLHARSPGLSASPASSRLAFASVQSKPSIA